MLSNNIPIINIDVKKEKEIKIVFLGDIHLGHTSCDEKSLNKTVRWIKNRSNVYVIGMGDYLELAIEGHIPGSMFTQKDFPDVQMDKFLEVMKPIKNRFLGMITGNHELSRGYKLNGIDPTKILCRYLNTPYWEDGGYVIVNLMKNKKRLQQYKLFIMHGCGTSVTPGYLPRKAMRSYINPDIIAMGHSHILWSGNDYKYKVTDEGLEKKVKVCSIRTGSYLDGARYAREKLYPPGAVGSPIVSFKIDEHKFVVDTETLEYVN